MSLRLRLFTWVAGVFFIAFAASFFLESHLTRTNLKKAYSDLLTELKVLNENKKEAIESYLCDKLNKAQAEIDAVLHGIAKYQLVRRGFAPTLENLKSSNWLSASSLLITNKWIGFVQSINEECLMSEIIIDNNPLTDVLNFPIDDALSFVAVRQGSTWSDPYVGININISTLRGGNVGEGQKESDEDYFVLFTPETLLNFKSKVKYPSINLSINLLEPFLKWMELPSDQFFLREFLKRIQRSQQFLKENPQALPSNHVWKEMLEKKSKGLISKNVFPKSSLNEREGDKGEEITYNKEQVDSYVERLLEHYNKVGLVWGLSTLARSSLFGKDPLSSEAPVGMGFIEGEKHSGRALLSKDIFYNEPQYNVSLAVKEMAHLPANFLTTHLDVIIPKDIPDIFLGNTLKLEAEEGGKQRTGYLTVGKHAGLMLESLARSVHRMSLLISGGKVYSVSTPEGIELENSIWHRLSSEELLSKEQGTIHVGDTEYYFLHIKPYDMLDLHFVIFNPTEQEFALLNSMNAQAEVILKTISLQMRLAALGGLLFVLLFLNNIAKKITRPISHLAYVTSSVAEGKLHEVLIPDASKKKHHDEIDALYHSFFEMVKGLKEKERVRGVLNKVVSKEIAEEALKGNIQLGGEEKYVTILFADIRHFTEMTEKMDPKEVIQLVNTCMTKVSDIIDKYGGVIDKYVGDAVMALFGAPIEKEDSALAAVRCAVDIIEALKEWNKENEGEWEVKMGIGIHTGSVVAGNMGAENRLNYTVLGANVNLASRLCSKAEKMEILISENTLQEEGVSKSVEVIPKNSMMLKGFTKAVSVFSVIGYRS